MFSYAGIPLLASFCSKFYLFFATLGCGAYFLAPMGVVTSVIGRWAAERLPRVILGDWRQGSSPCTGHVAYRISCDTDGNALQSIELTMTFEVEGEEQTTHSTPWKGR